MINLLQEYSYPFVGVNNVMNIHTRTVLLRFIIKSKASSRVATELQ